MQLIKNSRELINQVDSKLNLSRRRALKVMPAAALTLSSPAVFSASNRLVVGQSLPLSGSLSNYGLAKLLGSKCFFAAEERSRNAPVIDVVALDDGYDPLRTVANTNALAKEHGAVACLGYFGVPTVNAALSLFETLKLPIVGLTSGSRQIRSITRPYVFPVRASYEVEIAKIASHMQTMGTHRIAVLVQNNAFGQEVSGTFLQLAKVAGMTKVVTHLVAIDASDAQVVALSVADDTQAVFLATLSGPAIALIKALGARKVYKQIYGLSALDASVLVAHLGQASAGIIQSQVIPSPHDQSKSVCVRYVDALKRMDAQAKPSYFGLEGYIEAKVLFEGLRRANYNKSPDVLLASLGQLKRFDLGGVDVSYGAQGASGLRYVDLTILGVKGTTVS
jgi:branched-chain amino acid transport system substrate-binding protein